MDSPHFKLFAGIHAKATLWRLEPLHSTEVKYANLQTPFDKQVVANADTTRDFVLNYFNTMTYDCTFRNFVVLAGRPIADDSHFAIELDGP